MGGEWPSGAGLGLKTRAQCTHHGGRRVGTGVVNSCQLKNHGEAMHSLPCHKKHHTAPHTHFPSLWFTPLCALDVPSLGCIRYQALDDQALGTAVGLTETDEVQLHVGVVALRGGGEGEGEGKG